MKGKQVISTIEFQDFLKSCRQFCGLLETTDSNVLVELQKSLLELYLNGLNLQTIELDSNIDFKENIDEGEFEL